MRHLLFILFVALTAFAWTACSKSTPAPSKAPEAASTPKTTTTQAPAPTAAKAPAEAGKSAGAPAVADNANAKADESDMAPAAERKPQVSKEECEKACAHATKLSMASMPPDATPDMQAAIEKALKESCPRDCLANGTKALVECILGATNAMDLAAKCQK